MILSLPAPCLASEIFKSKSSEILNINPKALRFENLNSRNIEIYYNNNLLHQEKILQFFLDARPLIKTDFYPTNFKLKIYKFIDGKQIVLKVLNKNIKLAKSAEKSIFLTDLNLVNNQEDLYLDLYDTDDNLYGSYKIAVNFQNQTEAIVNNTENIDCDLDEPDCLLKFIFDKVNFSASFDNKLITEVTRLESGNYNVIIPVKKGRKLTDKVKNFNFTSEDGGKTNGKGNSNSGYYPYFNNNKDEVASSTWNEDDSSISFSTASLEDVFQILSNNTVAIRSNISQGLLNIGASSNGRPNIVFEPGSLSTSLIDGALEYDGSQLYFTADGNRIALGSGSGSGIPGPEGPAGPAGPTGPAGAAGIGIDLSNGGFLNGVINFTNNGVIQNAFLNGSLQYIDGNQAAGRVLTSDALGNATWQAAPSGGDTNGQVFVVNNNVISNNGSSADYQDDFVIGSPSLNYSGDANHASRMFFDKSETAFRIGSTSGNEWDDINLGNHSFAFGTNNTANGDYSTAWGGFNTASGFNSTSWGGNNSARGNHSTTWGQTNTSSGNLSTAWGQFNTSSGSHTTSWGFNNQATGAYSTSWGYNNQATGAYSTTWGQFNTASGNYSTAFGISLESNGDYSISMGRGNSSVDKLVNTTNQSLMVGFNSNAATLFVGPSAGGSTTGNVGIGTSTPARKLHISEAMRLEPQASPPAGPSTGDLYVDSDGLQALCIYLNGAWVVAAGSGACS